MSRLDEAGVEPLAMKILAGMILLTVGLGVGFAIYARVGKGVEHMLSFSVKIEGQPEYALTLGVPSSGENSATVTVKVEEITPYNKTVSLSHSGTPTNVSLQFSPPNGEPTFSSSLTIRVSPGAPTGTHAITIRATGEDGAEQTATLRITLT
ncbi:MAG: hypothetical protein QXW92_03680 [Candidatus Hadarchaeales archaeon]